MKDSENYKLVKKGMMGMRSINVLDRTEKDKFGKVKIIKVLEGYPAFEVGLKVDDYVLKINGVEIFDFFDIIDLGSLTSPGDKMTILINRKGKKKEFTFNVK